MELSALSLRLRALSVLRGLLSHPLVRAYGDTLTALDGTAADFADRYGALCAISPQEKRVAHSAP